MPTPFRGLCPARQGGGASGALPMYLATMIIFDT